MYAIPIAVEARCCSRELNDTPHDMAGVSRETMPMTALSAYHVPIRTPAVSMAIAAGMMLVLSSCVTNYRAVCVDAGQLAGSPALTECVQGQIDSSRSDRRRHLKYGSGG